MGMQQKNLTVTCSFIVVIDVVTELASDGVLSESQYAVDIVLMIEAIK